ncbi:PhzF family phenazine biosynthesis protein [Corynebacterium diphtheriae bv. mitis]|uniref:PhzF family phenazine biosynthesis protein n=1 Tax=Corynebacterium diphtheriae TaxID=1717 RepID=UPI0018CA53B0|nr:PhzF family phenazine biosynthesis protein [Corynebacterium diphtheriae]MBG9359475.1 PhzF family phenazine biosynthesis protein [Corynebacterium diphtheriae bv. mitis]MBG9361618.1 PhzF family phenazine biosynthesis protein [Corynebacterium diphtheriae bv. mitis]MBG9363776.1 PhzF family phenazine biosynthesis protein [Corynebacterium diphtheriae bv. mitis]MBG9366045.1 PhzF family phenazine biosynthesis protein [Corynebacterium diphtheriae bv. mitis]UWE84913.1 PhzF family phenazine biosynthes
MRNDNSTFSFSAPPLTFNAPLTTSKIQEVAESLGISVHNISAAAWGVNGPRWQLIQLADIDFLPALTPTELSLGKRLGVIAIADRTHVHVRAFVGAGEDPVTGSLNATIAQWLRKQNKVDNEYEAFQRQFIGAAGKITILDDASGIWIGGETQVQINGSIHI